MGQMDSMAGLAQCGAEGSALAAAGSRADLPPPAVRHMARQGHSCPPAVRPAAGQSVAGLEGGVPGPLPPPQEAAEELLPALEAAAAVRGGPAQGQGPPQARGAQVRHQVSGLEVTLDGCNVNLMLWTDWRQEAE